MSEKNGPQKWPMPDKCNIFKIRSISSPTITFNTENA